MMKSVKEGIDFLLDKYNVNKCVEQADGETAVIDGKKCALLPWRCERRFIELKSLAADSLKGISAIRVGRIDKKDADIMKMFRREADICEFISGSAVKEIFAVANGSKAMNVIMKLDNGIICTLELAAVLNDGERTVDKHEIIAQKGVACDRAVDTQVPQSSIYVFTGDDKEEYLDVDAELYGLSADEAAAARQCFEMARDGYCLCGRAAHLDEIVSACRRSADTEENVIL